MTRYALGARPDDRHGPAAGRRGRCRRPALYRTGCAGRMIAFSETEDGRYLITLTGSPLRHRAPSCRATALPRIVAPTGAPYRGDLDEATEPSRARAPARGAEAVSSAATTSPPNGRRSRRRRPSGWSTSLAMAARSRPTRSRRCSRRRAWPSGPAADHAGRDGGAWRRARRRGAALGARHERSRPRCRSAAAGDPGVPRDQGAAAL